ncbi:MAG: AAA family ATPase [Candidatus Njordarchaeales archaeon]
MIFVDREEELRKLEKLLNLRLSGTQTFVLLYGLRRVGKTTLIDKFLRSKKGVRIDCGSMVSGSDFFRGIYSALSDLGKENNALTRYRGLYEAPLDDDIEMINQAFDLLNEFVKSMNYLVVAFDELHGFIENYARLRGERYLVARERILWVLRNNLRESDIKIFFIIVTSAGFLFEEYGRADRAFMGLFHRVRIDPLSIEHSEELARKLLDMAGVEYSREVIREIARLSGGIPKVIELLVGLIIGKEKVSLNNLIEKVREALIRGDFDDFFEAYINFVADYSRWDKTTILRILRCLAEKKKPKEISAVTRIKYYTVLNILADLRKKHVITKNNEIAYPLLKEWLLAGKHPPSGKRRIDLLMQSLGITYEAYIRELLRSINKRIVIEGEELFFGTTDKLVIEPIDKVETTDEIDFIAHQKTCQYVIGKVKLGTMTKNDIAKLLRKKEELGIEAKAVIIAKNADPVAIAEATRRKVVIISHEAINQIARKIGKPSIKVD